MTFAGAMSAMLVNIDRCELPQGRRTPLGHSVAALALWSYIASMVLVALALCGFIAYSKVVPLAFALAIGYSTHLFLDALSDEGIYVFPNRRFPALEALPEGSGRQWAGWSAFRFGPLQKSYILHTTNQ
jgi:hypothetical protein